MEIGGIKVNSIVSQYPTPLFVYDENIIKSKFKEFNNNLNKRISLIYSIKANSSPNILKLLKRLGVSGFDCVGIYEVKLCLNLGFEPSFISCTSTAWSDEDLKFLINSGVKVKLDSISQIKRWILLGGGSVWLRLNSGHGVGHHEFVKTGGWKSKFGLYPNEFEKARLLLENANISIEGIHQHVGCSQPDTDLLLKNITPVFDIQSKYFPNVKNVNVGGGIPVNYSHSQKYNFDIQLFCSSLLKIAHEKDLYITMEPGRALVAESGYLLSTVRTIKKSPELTFAIVNTGFNHLIRPILYKAHHQILNTKANPIKGEEILVVGNICESGDIFGNVHDNVHVEEGDVLAICDVGAYGRVMSSNYTSLPLPAEIIISDKQMNLADPYPIIHRN